MKKVYVTVFCVLLLLANSCNSSSTESASETDDSLFEAPDETVITAANSKITNPANVNPNVQVSGQSGTWGAFEAMFKSCMMSSDFPDKKMFSSYKLLYLGPGNSKYLGTIFSNGGVVDKTELVTWVAQNEMNKFIRKGFPVKNCNVQALKDNVMDLFVDFDKVDQTDTAFKSAVTKKDSITINSFEWSIDEFKTAELKKYLKENSKNADIKFYLDEFSNPKNIVAFKLVKIKGFNCDIHSKRAISGDLQAKLNSKNPFVMAIEKASLSTDSISFGLKFSSTKEKTIHVESDGEFFAFALAMKGKKF